MVDWCLTPTLAVFQYRALIIQKKKHALTNLSHGQTYTNIYINYLSIKTSIRQLKTLSCMI